MNLMKSKALVLLLSVILNILAFKPAFAGSLDWLAPLPIDGFGHDYYFSADMEWRGNYFTWDGGRALRERGDYWEDQLTSNRNRANDPYLYGYGHLRVERNWRGFSLGYVTGVWSEGSGTGNLDDLYRQLKNSTGAPGELYNVGYRYYTIQYQGLSLGYTWESQSDKLLLGVRGQWLTSRNYREESYQGLVRFTDPNHLQGFIYNEQWDAGEDACNAGEGYSFDLMGRLNTSDRLSLFATWRDIGEMTWKASRYKDRTLNYQLQIDPDGSIDIPYIIESRQNRDHSIRLDDRIHVGAAYQFNSHALTLGLSYQDDEFHWGLGEKIRIDEDNMIVLGYDDRESSLAAGWQFRDLAFYINCNNVNPSKATMLGIGCSWMI